MGKHVCVKKNAMIPLEFYGCIAVVLALQNNAKYGRKCYM